MTAPAKASVTKGDKHEIALELLRASIEELHFLTIDFVRLGEEIADGLGESQSPMLIRKLQSFDVLGQRAMSQVALLRGLERTFSGDAASLQGLIAAIPFHELRKRLESRVSGAESAQDCTVSSESAGEMDLF
jgi:hypothetical protein